MLPWLVYYRLGLRRLARHEPQAALRFFDAAVSLCPVESASRLARILFYAGTTLKKLGAHDSAVRSWGVSFKLLKTLPILHYLKWFSNEYGMAKHDFADTDDWGAFYSLHMRRYLREKNSDSLETAAERDMIRDLIFDAWLPLVNSGRLEGKTTVEKLALFRDVKILFPVRCMPAVLAPGGAVFQDCPCACGSGLPARLCCGNSGHKEEAVIETF